MTTDEFTRRLIGFGLSEKEAQLYLHLLKYGPKTPSPLATSARKGYFSPHLPKKNLHQCDKRGRHSSRS
jgi:hypothetical protein